MSMGQLALESFGRDESTVSIEVVFQPGVKLEEIEKQVILATLKQQGFNRTHAARVLGIGIRTLQRKLKKYGAEGLGLRRSLLSA